MVQKHGVWGSAKDNDEKHQIGREKLRGDLVSVAGTALAIKKGGRRLVGNGDWGAMRFLRAKRGKGGGGRGGSETSALGLDVRRVYF